MQKVYFSFTKRSILDLTFVFPLFFQTFHRVETSGTADLSVSVIHRPTPIHLALVKRCDTSWSLLFGCRQTAASTDIRGADA